MPQFIRKSLGNITMYRLMLYYLLALWLASIVFSLIGILEFNSLDIFLTGIYLITLCHTSNYATAKLIKAKTNLESATITALILTLIVGPANLSSSFITITLIGVLGVTSKYLIAFRKKHVFNPAAIAVFSAAILLGSGASWWIGSMSILPIIIIGGFIILIKIRRFQLVGSFLLIYFLSQILLTAKLSINTFLSPIMWFFVFVMLIEPLTSPSTKNKQILFGGFVALVYFLLPIIIPGYSYSLETALLMGNLLNFTISPTFNLVLTFSEKKKIASDTWAFYFRPMSTFSFTPGQYLEWTLPHKRPDSRGTRRYFTISSAPGEPQIMLTMRVSEKGSSFKSAMMSLKNGQELTASSPQGDFVLPKDKKVPLVFIAGGIGITPFRSMIKHMFANNEKRDIVLLYLNRTDKDIAFKKLLHASKAVGVKTVFINTKTEGHIDEKTIRKRVPGYKKRTYYISGPEPMVEDIKSTLSKLKVSGIKTDYFPGYN